LVANSFYNRLDVEIIDLAKQVDLVIELGGPDDIRQIEGVSPLWTNDL